MKMGGGGGKKIHKTKNTKYKAKTTKAAERERQTQGEGKRKKCTKQNRPNTRLSKQKLNQINRCCRMPWTTAKEGEFPQRMLLLPVRENFSSRKMGVRLPPL